jgi:trans-2,3-dihydro-3-hydroxyanthranilate isomerase
MRRFPFVTMDVFTDRQFGGNPLAVFTAAEGLSGSAMQELAAEMNLSETTFVLPPVEPDSTARVRIFNRTAEMPFAGHPSLGTAVVLAQALPGLDVVRLDLPAGLTTVEVRRDASGQPVGGVVAAPQPLSVGEIFPAEEIAACASLDPGDLLQHAHPPVLASTGNSYVIAQVAEGALGRARPDPEAFARSAAARPHLAGRLSLHLYTASGDHLRARMFAPLAGTFEDPATGSANAPLAGLLLSLRPGEASLSTVVVQGVEMGRPSLLEVTASRSSEGIRTTVGGGCVPVLRGEALLREGASG